MTTNSIEIKSDDAAYQEIFNKFDIPFADRLEKAVRYANERMEENEKFRSRMRFYFQTGIIPITNY